MSKKKTVTPRIIETVLYTSFCFAYMENATNVSMALAQAGYFVNTKKEGTGIRVDIYKLV